MFRAHSLLLLTCIGVAACGCDSKAKPATDMSAKSQSPSIVAPKVSASTGTTSSDDSFSFANVSHKVKVGEASRVTFEVRPAKGFKINPEYPWSVTLEGSKPLGTTGLKMSKEQLDVDATRVKADVPLQPVGAGKHFLKGSANISVCETTGAKKCLLFNDEPVTLEIDAQKI